MAAHRRGAQQIPLGGHRQTGRQCTSNHSGGLATFSVHWTEMPGQRKSANQEGLELVSPWYESGKIAVKSSSVKSIKISAFCAVFIYI